MLYLYLPIQIVLLILQLTNLIIMPWLVVFLPLLVGSSQAAVMFVIDYVIIKISQKASKETPNNITPLKETCKELEKKFLPKTTFTPIKPIERSNEVSKEKSTKKKKRTYF